MSIADELDRGPLIAQLRAAIVANGAPTESSRIVGLSGPWGSGKSWLVEEVRHSLDGITREFNPWLYSDELGLYRGYATFLIERIKDKRTRRKIARALDYIGPSMKGFGFDVSGSLKEASEALKGLSTPSEITKHLAAHFDDPATRTYVLVDDLDRLTPTELLLFFKLLRLVGNLPNIVYVLVYDEVVLLQLLAQTEIGGGSVDRARLYLDKIVEVRVSIPRITRRLWKRHLLDPLVAFGIQANGPFAESDVEQANFDWSVESAMWGNVHTKRVIDRLVETVTSLPRALYGEINYLDWCRISYVRVVHPQTWQLIVDHPYVFAAEHIGSGMRFMQGEGKERASELAETIRKSTSTTFEGEDLLALLDELFPRFARDRAGDRPSYSSEPDRAGQHIGDERYFYRYFSHQLPENQVSDMQVRALLRELGTAGGAKAELELTALFRAMPEDTLVAIGRRQVESISPRALFNFLSSLVPLPELEYRSGHFGLRGSSNLLLLAIEALQRASTETFAGWAVPESGPVDPLLVAVLTREKSPAGSAPYVAWIAAQRQALADRADAELRMAKSPVDKDAQAAMWFHYLTSLDPLRAMSLAKEALGEGRWRADDVASLELRDHHQPGEPTTVRSVHLSERYRLDPRMIELLRAGERTSYPSDWDLDPDFVLEDLNLFGRQLGALVIAKLERGQTPKEAEDDDI